MENPRAMVEVGEALPRDIGSGEDVYFCANRNGEARFYHVELKTKKKPCNKKRDPIPLTAAAILDPYVTGRSGAWTACGEHIYLTGGLYRKPSNLFKHNISKYDLEEWEILHQNNRRSYPFRNQFAIADALNQKLYFIGSSYDIDGTSDAVLCGECFHLPTQTWVSLDHTPIKDIRNYHNRFEVAAKVKDRADEPIEIVYYDLSDGSILYVDVTDGGRCRRVGANDLKDFALLRHPLESPPQGLHGINLKDLIGTVMNTRAVVTKQTFYWFNVDMRLIAYDIKAKTWLKSPPLSDHFTPPCLDTYSPPLYPLLLGLPHKRMVLIILTSPEELTVASLLVHRMIKNNKPSLHVTVEATQTYCFDDPERAFMLLSGEALLKTSSFSIPVRKGKNSALSAAGGRIMDDSGSKAKGTLKLFNGWKGFGFRTPNDAGKDQYFHKFDILSKGFRSLAMGEAVEFEDECGRDGCTKAVCVIVSDGAAVQGGISRYRSGGSGCSVGSVRLVCVSQGRWQLRWFLRGRERSFCLGMHQRLKNIVTDEQKLQWKPSGSSKAAMET